MILELQCNTLEKRLFVFIGEKIYSIFAQAMKKKKLIKIRWKIK